MIDLRLVELNLMFDEIFVLKDDLRFMKKKKIQTLYYLLKYMFSCQ